MGVIEARIPAAGLEAFGGCKVIDADSLLTEPHDLWLGHAPASLRNRVPLA
jgi:hypothetical protein